MYRFIYTAPAELFLRDFLNGDFFSVCHSVYLSDITGGDRKKRKPFFFYLVLKSLAGEDGNRPITLLRRTDNQGYTVLCLVECFARRTESLVRTCMNGSICRLGSTNIVSACGSSHVEMSKSDLTRYVEYRYLLYWFSTWSA